MAVLATVRRLSQPFVLWLAAGGSWLAALVMDEVPWEGAGLGSLARAGLTTGVEELFEMGGSALFILALLAVLDRRA